MAGVFRAVGYTLLLVLCGTSMFFGQGAYKPPPLLADTIAPGSIILACPLCY